MARQTIPTALGRLLSEVSWDGKLVNRYREGGRGLENVLTVEVLQALDFLPRTRFLGAVLRNAHGPARVIETLVKDIEKAEISLLPGDMYLDPIGKKVKVQPDGLIETPKVAVLVEAKRIRSSQFQTAQLARELVLIAKLAEDKIPSLLLILGDVPPIAVQRHGKLTIEDAIELKLEESLKAAEEHPYSKEQLLDMIPESVIWTTWSDISQSIEESAATFMTSDQSLGGSIQRLANTAIESVKWHS